jgi:hypothetical protein
MMTAPEDRAGDYFFGAIPGRPGGMSSIRVDDTILPGCSMRESKVFGVRFRTTTNSEAEIRTEFSTMLAGMGLTLQLATETSPGDRKELIVGTALNMDKVLELLKSKGFVQP